MRIFLLANNSVGLTVARYLRKQNEEIVGLAIHEPEKQKYTKEIIDAVEVPEDAVFNARSLRTKEVIKNVKKLKPDIMIAAFWGYILKPELFSIAPRGCINFHPGYLPYNRGMNPNVWPFLENTPAGVTIHYVDEGIDTGDIIARKKVRIEKNDTAGTVYDKTLIEIEKLFKKYWPRIKNGTAPRISQSSLQEIPTFHKAKDIESTDEIELDRSYTGREIIQKLKARSYSSVFFPYYIDGNEKVFLRLEMGPIEKIEENSKIKK